MLLYDFDFIIFSDSFRISKMDSKICLFRLYLLSLHRNDTLYKVTSPAAMAKECLCLCTDIFQQSSVGDGVSVANACVVCIVLYDIQLYLLFQ